MSFKLILWWVPFLESSEVSSFALKTCLRTFAFESIGSFSEDNARRSEKDRLDQWPKPRPVLFARFLVIVWCGVVFAKQNDTESRDLYRLENNYEYEIRLNVLRVLSKKEIPVMLRCIFLPEKLVLSSLLKEVKPSTNRTLIKLLTFDKLFRPLDSFLLKLVEGRRLSCFPAKMTLAHACGLLGMEKISSSS